MDAITTSFALYLASECGLSRATMDAYGRDVQGFLAWYNVPLTALTPAHLSGWLQHESRQGHSTATVIRKVQSVRAFLKFLAITGQDTAQLLNNLDAPKREQRLPNVLGRQQTAALVEAESASPLHVRDRAILETLYATGIRASELCALKISDLNLNEGWIRVLGKGQKERIVPLGEQAGEAIREYLAQERRIGAQHVFLSYTGQPLERVALWHIVQRAARRASLTKHISTHTLRHCCASHLLSGGADLRVVQELLGHASVNTTQIYTHVDMERLKKTQALLGR